MKATIHGDTFSFNVMDLIESLDLEGKRKLADSIACSDDVIDFVTQQILDGWTEFDSHGGISAATVEPYRGLAKSIRDVARRAPEVAAKEISRLEDSLRRSNAECERLQAECEQLRNAKHDAACRGYVVVPV